MEYSLDKRLGAALEKANLPTLACILVHLTGDRAWIEGKFRPSRTRGLDDNDGGGYSDEVANEIRSAARVALLEWFDGKPLAKPNLSDEELVELMGISLGETIPIEYASMVRGELQLPPWEGAVASSAAERSEITSPPPGFNAIIIGAGISGLCAAVNLAAAGIPYTIVERQNCVGGVWAENCYPGSGCDVPSYLYSYSFSAFDWSRFFAGRAEIHQYLVSVAEKFDVLDHIRFGQEVISASYDEVSETWSVEMRGEDGSRQCLRGNILISAVGAFNKPRLPKVPGLASFKGPSVHTTHFPKQGLDLTGKRVVLVGNGASAMQVGPAIADQVSELTIVQRTPQWIAPFPKFAQDIPDELRWLLHEVPLYRLWYRLRLSWAFNDKLYEALQQDPEWSSGGVSINAVNDSHRIALTEYARRELADVPEYLPMVVPDYPPFGKRMLLDNGWFKMLAKKNVRLVVSGVKSVFENGVILDDDSVIEADALIWATGFDVVNFIAPMKVIGKGGVTLQRDWNGDDARAYLGTVVHGYPNFFCLYGPNTQFGHGGSLITILERQMHYVMSLLKQMFEQGISSIEVCESVFENYNKKVDEIHSGMVWTFPGVETYYKNSRGRVVVNNPFRVIQYWKMTEKANLIDYNCISDYITTKTL